MAVTCWGDAGKRQKKREPREFKKKKTTQMSTKYTREEIKVNGIQQQHINTIIMKIAK